MSLSSFFRSIYYSIFSSDTACRKKVRNFLSTKVQSPFDSAEVIKLGDLLVSTSINEPQIMAIAESYGIKFPKEAVTAGMNRALEYLLYHNKDFVYSYLDSNGKPIEVELEQIRGKKGLPLIPGSYLDKIVNCELACTESFTPIFGETAGLLVEGRPYDIEIETRLPAVENSEIYDIDSRLPMEAMNMRASYDIYKNYIQYSQGEITWESETGSAGKNKVKAAIFSPYTLGAAGALTARAVRANAQSISDAWEGISGDFDWDTFQTVGEIGLILAIGAGICYGVKKLWRAIVGDPLEKLKNLLSTREGYLSSAGMTLVGHRSEILEYFTPKEKETVNNDLALINNRMGEKYGQYHVKPLEYYVLQYKQELLASMSNTYQSYENSLNTFFDRIQMLSQTLGNCRSEIGDLESMTKEFRQYYTNLPDNINSFVRNVKNHAAFGQFVASVLDKELRLFVPSIRDMRLQDIDNVMETLDYYDEEIRKETEIQREKGNLEA